MDPGQTEAMQAAVYAGVVDTCLAEPACRSLTTWGFTDRYSWRKPRTPLSARCGLRAETRLPRPPGRPQSFSARVATLGSPSSSTATSIRIGRQQTWQSST